MKLFRQWTLVVVIRVLKCSLPSIVAATHQFSGPTAELISCYKFVLQKRVRVEPRDSPVNLPGGSHQGGVWERVVRIIEHDFYAIFGTRCLTNEILVTTFCLVEQSLNTRILVPVSSSATNSDALTPIHFLFGSVCSTMQYHQRTDIDPSKRYGRAQTYSDAIWDRLLKDYVPSLHRRSTWLIQDRRSRLHC